VVNDSKRQLGDSELWVSPIALGCWPMAGISSIGVNDADSMATIEAALECGINHFDTAYSYGYSGESDRLLRRVLGDRADVVIATKVGSHYTPDKQRVLDARPETLKRHAMESCERLGRSTLDVLYLHTPDSYTPIEQSAEALADLQQQGIARYIGLSNATPDESRRFASIVRPIVVQPPFNMLQQQTFRELQPLCLENHCGTAVYWPLMKGLLAGKLQRDHQFDPSDRRLTYPMFTGREWDLNQDFLDKLRSLAAQLGWTVTRLVVRWTMDQPGVTSVLCGAKRPEQIRESAEAMRQSIPLDINQQIEQAIMDRGIIKA
jgi:aryl-alcohol dehydrogenase-like predicted oxidoreductase